MFDKYMISDGSFKNVKINGAVTGFQIGVRITYYRGIALSIIDGFTVSVDGENFETDAMTFTVKGHGYTFDEMIKTPDKRWDFGEVAILTIKKNGGLTVGKHEVKVTERIIQDYGTLPMRVDSTSWSKELQIA